MEDTAPHMLSHDGQPRGHRWLQGTSMANPGDIDGYRGHRWPTQGTSIVTHLHEWHFPLVGFVRLPTELGNQPTAEQQREGEGEWGGKVRHAYTTCTDLLPPPAVSHLMRYAPSLSASAKVPAGEGFPDHCLHPIACLGLSLWVILGLHLKGRTSRQTETGDA